MRRHPFACVAMMLVAAGSAGAQDSLRITTRRRTLGEDLQLFSQVLNQIRVNHPDSLLDTHSLLMSAIEGMVSAADPHSFVIPAARLDSTREAAVRSGKLFYVPVDFQYVGGAPLVSGVTPGTKAASLDILPGDELVAADGRPIAASSDDELDLALAGPRGSSVKLLLRRRRPDGTIARLERLVERQRIDDISAVPVGIMLPNATGYVRVTTFSGEKVADDLHSALNRLEKGGMKRLVLDLRGNGGGRIDEARRIAGEFLPRGAVIYTASGRKAEVNDTARVERSFWSSERRYPIVLLVDEGTASASELVAGALQDHDRATIVGRTTFGKSLIMQTFPLTDGSRMSLVIGKLRTPCGRIIQREYRGTSRREYYREAGQSAHAGAPSCKTDGGKVVYGGGGIVPDVELAQAGTPAWLARASEMALLATWSGGYVESHQSALTTIDVLAGMEVLDAATLANFRTYAASAELMIPDDAESSAKLSAALLRAIAYARFGESGYYHLIAITDPDVQAAVRAFDATTVGKE